MSVANMRGSLAKPPNERRREDVENLATRFADLPFFARMPWQVRVDLCHALELERCDKGKIVFLEGDPGDKMYIILSGRVRLTISGHGNGRPSTGPLKMLGPGEQFGELALLKKGVAGVRAGTVTAEEECEFVTLDRKSYDKTMRAEDISRIHAVTEFLSRCAMFRTWSKGALTRLSLYCYPVEPRRGETLLKAGEKAQFVYMLQEGECGVVFNSKTEEQEAKEAEEAKAAEVAAEMEKLTMALRKGGGNKGAGGKGGKGAGKGRGGGGGGGGGPGGGKKKGEGSGKEDAEGGSNNTSTSTAAAAADTSAAHAAEHQHHVALLGPHDCFGELSVLANEPMSHSVVCSPAGHHPVKLLRISAAEFSHRISTSGMAGAELEAMKAARARWGSGAS